MVSWQSLAIAALTVLGIACCGIGGISIFAGGMSDNYGEPQGEHGGCIIGAAAWSCCSGCFLLRLS
jgi:hypothetical protein